LYRKRRQSQFAGHMLKTLLTFPAEPFINEAVAIRRCPYCKAIIDESQKYCNNCGTQLLFPEDELNEEPIKGEKILDEDFKDDDENKGFEEPADGLDVEREEIDLDAVLKGAGHFPDEPAPSAPPASLRPSSDPAPKPPAAEPDVLRRAPRPRKKFEPAIPKNDTREEIARLIAALEEKEKKEAEAPAPPARESVPEMEPESKTPLEAAFNLPEPEPPEESPALGDEELPPESVSEPTSWEALLKKSPSADLENGPLPGAFEPVDEPEEEEPSAVEGPPANPTAGDTMDFEEELFRRTPPAISPPTSMGIPERVAGESALLPQMEEAEAPKREKVRRPLFEEEIPAAVPADAGTDEEQEAAPRRLGIFRKIGALLFDVVFIGAVCLASLWLAARLMDVALFDLVSTARVAAGLYFLALLFGYFFLILFFLGETLGDRLASPRS
jgi:hypothetical protein